MRNLVNVLWLDDQAETALSFKQMKRLFETSIKELGYQVDFDIKTDYDEALAQIKTNKRIDLIITDFNIQGEGKTGVKFLTELRENESHKEMVVLYSKNDESQIKQDIIDSMTLGNLRDFSNFSYFSTSVSAASLFKTFSEISKVFFSRWHEFNALRGRYACEHGIIEQRLRLFLGDKVRSDATYDTLINEYLVSLPSAKRLLIRETWMTSKNIRNQLIHEEEQYDETKGYFLSLNLNGKVTILTSDNIIKYRKDLIDHINKITNFLDINGVPK